jgi:hypothetical protein
MVELAAAGANQGIVQRQAFATLEGLLIDAPYDDEEDTIFASCVARLQRHEGDDSSLHLVMQLARAGGLRDPKGPYVRAMACWVVCVCVCAIAGLTNEGEQSERWSWRS